MASRHKLHDELIKALGNNRVYFQPPESVKLKYPCIIYKRATGFERNADDESYLMRIRYTITLIDPNPDSQIIEKIRRIHYCAFDRHYVADNLNHDVFNVYY